MGFGSSLRHAVSRAIRPATAAATFGISEVDPGAKAVVKANGKPTSEEMSTGLKGSLRQAEGAASLGGTELNRKYGINYGGENDALFGGAKKAQNKIAVAEERARLKAQQENENELLRRADAQYGIGLSPEAQANASRMRARRSAASERAFGDARSEAERNYATGLSDTRITLARAGLAGSGVEGQARNDLLSRYFGGITEAQQAGEQVGQNFQTDATQQRLGLRKGIRGGQITDTTGLSSEIAGLNAQGSNGAMWERASGQFLPVAAGIYGNQRLANAYGSR